MPYFSRLTDIVTCNLTSILEHADDKEAVLKEIIFEMTEGLAGAERSVGTASTNVSRLEVEIGEQRQQAEQWVLEAQNALASGNENQARSALERKHEVEDLIAGLEQQLAAAVSTRDHLKTILNALQARLADGRRRLRSLDSETQEADVASSTGADPETPAVAEKKSKVDAELEALRKQMQAK
ncbi:PspA/IM30 family protein [Thalassoglobus sp. JC818]|uniref:PspA/IM30 family protein n=1 Tax=Thalassoglobus sp. JC818 TaxID=3232136 RepID=UPI003459095C